MKPRLVVLLLALLALLAKVYCARTTIGSSDVAFFYTYARSIHEHGLLAMYEETPFFNHTPLVGWFAEAVYSAVHGDRLAFVFFLRLPGILADLAAVLVLVAMREKLGRPAWWALGLFAASPVAFMISGYHGNVDSVMAAVVLFAAVACVSGRPALCGLWLALACQIKIIPLLLAPAFFFYWWQRGKAGRFALPAIFTTLLGWSYPLATIPAIFLKNVIGYGSIWGVWGFTYLLRLTDLPSLNKIAFAEATPAQASIMLGLKVIVVLSALGLAWSRRATQGAGIFQTLALIWAVFFVFAPGFGSQYLAWLAPCFLVANVRWYAALTASSSIALFAFYTVISHGLPWRQGFTVHSIADQWTYWFVLPWLVLVAFLGWQGRRAWVGAGTRALAPTVPTPA